jgi:ABC-type amino acid transport substrate-binding protein
MSDYWPVSLGLSTVRSMAITWVTAVILLMSGGSSLSQPSREAICQKLKVSGARDWMPVSYIDEATGKPAGVAVDVVNRLGIDLSLPIEFDMRYPWARVMTLGKQGAFDIIAGFMPNPERASLYLFSHPVHIVNMGAYVRYDSEIDVNKLEDLGGLTHIALRGSIRGGDIDAIVNKNTLWVNTMQQLVEMLLAKRGDYFFSSNEELDDLRRHYKTLKVKKLQLYVDSVDVVLGISRSSPCAKHMEQIDNVVRQFFLER